MLLRGKNLILRFYTTNNILSIIKYIKIIYNKILIIMILNISNNIFIIYMAIKK